MAIYKKDKDRCITITEKDYLTLIEDHMILKALKIAGVEQMPIYKSIDSIMKDRRIEVHIRPLEKRYR